MPTGIAMALPEGYVALVHPRSGLAARHGLSIVNTPGTIDAGLPRRDQGAAGQPRPAPSRSSSVRGDRIAQLVVQRFERASFVEVDALPESVRGAGGYGSTGGFAASGTRMRRTGARVRFGRRAAQEPDDGRRAPLEDRPRGGRDPGRDGPHDADGLDLERRPPTTRDRIDLGGLLLAPPPEGVELRLQVDEDERDVLAVMLAGEEGALELRPSPPRATATSGARCAPRSPPRPPARRHGRPSSRVPSAPSWSAWCRCRRPTAQPATQPSRVIGVNGPRWLLRATLIGQPAVEAGRRRSPGRTRWRRSWSAAAPARCRPASPWADAAPESSGGPMA